MRCQVEVYWIVTPCGVAVGYHIHPEDEGSKVLRNVGILPQHYTASQTRRPRLEFSPPCKRHISN